MRDELDRILSEEEQILPSSGFVASVMAAVRHQAATSAPIPFPWRRALPGLAAAAVTLVSLLLAAVARSAVLSFSAQICRSSMPSTWETKSLIGSPSMRLRSSLVKIFSGTCEPVPMIFA